LDATVARFSPTGAIWFYDEDPTNKTQQTFLNHLRDSFIETLSQFPQWAGQLQWAPTKPNGSHTERFNRPIIVYGTEADPGVEWSIVEHPFRADEIVPTANERAATITGNRSGAWNGNDFTEGLYISPTQLALQNLKDYIDLPAMQVQINLLHGGGYAIGIKMSHCLADAQTLMVFVHLWAFNSRKQCGQQPKPSIMGDPVFDPTLLDSCAAGDIDAAEPDMSLTKIARELPLHRYSWWDISDEGYPKFFIPTTENSKPPTVDLALAIQQNKITPSTPAPWPTWDLTQRTSYALVHFTGSQLQNLKAEALTTQSTRNDISRLDTLLAHLWKRITKARQYTTSKVPVYLDLSLGARQRVQPPLPETFIGSPLFLTHVGMPGSQTAQATLGEIAAKIRDTMTLFTPQAMGAMLHDAAYEISPQRLWQGFCGQEHIIVTSWLRLGLYDVDFGFGGAGESGGAGNLPRYVHAVMPKVDGCLQIMDSAVGDGGMDVAVYLDEEDMGTLLEDILV
jgi:hypothetical protein